MIVRGNDLGLGVNVFKDGKDCTNGGLSSTEGTYYIFGLGLPLEGHMSHAEVERLGYRTIWLGTSCGSPVAKADPTPEQISRAGGDASNLCGPMMGGNFVSTSDSRLSNATGMHAAIPLHDRYETREQSEALSI